MPAAHVQHTSARTFGPGTSLSTAAFGSAVTTGNAIAVAVKWSSLTVTLNSVTDSQGNSYTLVQNPTTGGIARFAMAYALNVTGGASFVATANFSADPGAWCDIIAHEMSGIPTSGAFDGSGARAEADPGTGADAIDTASITTTADGDYIFGAVSGDTENASTISAGSAGTLRVSSANDYGSESQIQSSAGSIAVAFTQTGGGAFADYLVGIMAFKAGEPPPPPPPGPASRAEYRSRGRGGPMYEPVTADASPALLLALQAGVAAANPVFEYRVPEEA